MNVTEWVGENLEYGRKLVNTGLEGAQAGGEAALGDERLPAVLAESAPGSLGLAALGAGVGLVCSYLGNKRKLSKESVVFGLLGAVTGLLVGLGWSTRHVTNGIAVGAMKNINMARDEHWLDRHPIDYA